MSGCCQGTIKQRVIMMVFHSNLGGEYCIQAAWSYLSTYPIAFTYEDSECNFDPIPLIFWSKFLLNIHL